MSDTIRRLIYEEMVEAPEGQVPRLHNTSPYFRAAFTLIVHNGLSDAEALYLLLDVIDRLDDDLRTTRERFARHMEVTPRPMFVVEDHTT